jgi:hypothetical protein
MELTLSILGVTSRELDILLSENCCPVQIVFSGQTHLRQVNAALFFCASYSIFHFSEVQSRIWNCYAVRFGSFITPHTIEKGYINQQLRRYCHGV